MKIATVPSKRRRDLVIIAILLIGIPVLVFASYQVYQFFVGASVEARPQDVVISNVETNSVVITWNTEVSATGSVVPMSGGEGLSPVLDVRGPEKRETHYVELQNLEPNSQYEFVIVSDSEKYTQEDGNNFEFKTAPVSAETPTANLAHGSVSGVSGDDVVVFALLRDKSAYPVSATMPRGGSWMLDLSGLRSISDKSLIVVNPQTNIVLVAVTGSTEGAVVEGEYSELIDSNGRLKEVYPLNIAPETAVYSYFPEASIFQASSEESLETSTEEAFPLEPSEESEEPVEFEGEDEEFERSFELVHDLQWEDMVTSGGAVSGEIGESSVQIANITDKGFSVAWVSEEREEGYVKYGTSATDFSAEANDERDGASNRSSYYVHIVSVSRLTPETEYFFEINSGDNVYDNAGSKYRVVTFPEISSSQPFEAVSGEIEGIPDHNEAVLIARISDEDGAGSQGESSKVATSVDENGRWILSIADSRTNDGTSYFEYTSGDTLYMGVLTTLPATTYEESMRAISDRDIEISLEEAGEMGYTEAKLLDDYGVLGYSTGESLEISDG